MSCLLKLKIAFPAFLWILFTHFLYAGENETFKCALSINKNYVKQGILTTIRLDADQDAHSVKSGMAPGSIPVEIKAAANDTVILKIDTNNDNRLTDEAEIRILPDSLIIVHILRPRPNGPGIILPYEIQYSISIDKKNKPRQIFYWRSLYRAEGSLEIDDCKRLIAVIDPNGDGLFNRQDSWATTIQMDMNDDGEIWGADEYFRANHILQYCNHDYLIETIAEDGSSIVLKRTGVAIPKTGKNIPHFVLKTTTEALVSSSQLKGNVYLLDFWASWCKPCLEKFTVVQKLSQEFNGKIQFYLINTDHASRLDHAQKAVTQYHLEFPLVMTGLGDQDPIWRMFGSMSECCFSIPFYVLVNREGEIIYAGNGGNGQLDDLRGKMVAALSD